MRNIPMETKEDYVAFYVDIWQLLNLPEELRVRDRVREFLIHCVVMYHEGWVLYSKEAVQELADRMGFKNDGEVYNYRIKLKKKGIIMQTRDSLILAPALRIKNIRKRTRFNFTLVNEFLDEVG